MRGAHNINSKINANRQNTNTFVEMKQKREEFECQTKERRHPRARAHDNPPISFCSKRIHPFHFHQRVHMPAVPITRRLLSPRLLSNFILSCRWFAPSIPHGTRLPFNVPNSSSQFVFACHCCWLFYLQNLMPTLAWVVAFGDDVSRSLQFSSFAIRIQVQYIKLCVCMCIAFGSWACRTANGFSDSAALSVLPHAVNIFLL